MKTPLYLRVRTDNKQDNDNQRLQLRQFCQTQGWEVLQECEDHESGSRGDRPHFRRMLDDASAREFDLLLFWALDRLTREGTLATLKHLERLESYGVRWRSFTEPWIDSAGPFRDVVISLLASLAKQERRRIKERAVAGLQRARLKGTRSGRPIGGPQAVFNRDQVVDLRCQGLSWAQITARLGLSTGSVSSLPESDQPLRALPKPYGSGAMSDAESKGLPQTPDSLPQPVSASPATLSAQPLRKPAPETQDEHKLSTRRHRLRPAIPADLMRDLLLMAKEHRK